MTESIDVIVARTFLERCPVGWGIDSGCAELERREDGWYERADGIKHIRISLDEAVEHLLDAHGFSDYAGIYDLVDRLRDDEHASEQRPH